MTACHVGLNGSAANPVEYGFEVVLSVGCSAKQVACHLVRRASGLREVFLGVGEPGSGVDCISKFLVRKLEPGNIDRLEPIQFLTILARAEVDHESVVQDLVLLVLREGMEVLVVDRELALDELANGNGPLLSVHDLERPIFIDCPIEDIEWVILPYGRDDAISLLRIVHVLPLVLRSNVELVRIPNHTVFVIILVSGGELSDRDLLQFDFHWVVIPWVLRICQWSYIAVDTKLLFTAVLIGCEAAPPATLELD